MVNTSDIEVFDRRSLRRNRSRSAAAFAHHDFLFSWAANQLSDRLGDIRRQFQTVLQIGGRYPLPFQAQHNFVTDISAEVLKGRNGIKIVTDEEFLPFRKHSLDLIVSNLSLHSVNDLPGALLQIRHALKPDGLFLACMLGGESLHELRESLTQAEIELKGGISPRVFPFADKQQMGALMQRAGFALPVIDSEIVTVTYDSMFNLMHDLRGMGEGNIIARRNKIPPGRKFFLKAAEFYKNNFGEPDDRIKVTFEILFLIGWAPHDSQQQPLKPGSATKRLAEVLEAKEIKTGDQTAP